MIYDLRRAGEIPAFFISNFSQYIIPNCVWVYLNSELPWTAVGGLLTKISTIGLVCKKERAKLCSEP
ncbi:hypothetical protein B0E43_22665 [Algoriphagus sp. A40]|nr:hypothetical protein B0E43_22665 [Algoriphagus sp. A40]